MKDRLDVMLVRKGFFPSREKAKGSIMAGLVFVDGQRIDKAGTMISEELDITVKQNACPYVSRGGLKLEKAINDFKFKLDDKICMDVGASTGGFTDCMLKNNAKKVYSIDVGYGQLDWKLRNDERVVNIEKTNFRYIDSCIIKDKIDFVSIDVSFISLKLIFPKLIEMLNYKGEIVCLVKPQFEAGRDQVGKKGIVKDYKIHKEVLMNVISYALENNLYPWDINYSPITGAKGNIEYLLYLKKYEHSNFDKNIFIEKVVLEAHKSLI